jgi:hypothetical protein
LKHAKELIKILEQGEQEIPQSLIDMSDRYDAMLKKKAEEREPTHGNRDQGHNSSNSFGNRRGRGGFGGGFGGRGGGGGGFIF